MGKIFISHAAADKELVDAFVDFLITACGVDQKNIFCTSLEGMGIREGADFYETIRKAMEEAIFVIMLITPSYYESLFCLCELGATWILQRNCFPIVVPPLTYADLKAVLTPMQVAMVNDRNKLGNLFDRLKELKLGSDVTARFNLKCDTFLKKFAGILIKGRTSVSAKELQDLKALYDAALEDNVAKDGEISRIKKQFEELAKTKDAADVGRIRLLGSTEPKQFDSLCETFREAASKIPPTALEAIYHEHRGEEYSLPQRYGNELAYAEAQDAAQRQFVALDNRLVHSDGSHPQINNVQGCLSTLQLFMEETSQEFQEKYGKDHDHQFSLMNRDFWQKNLGL